MYKKRIDRCFLVVQQFGKKAIDCKGNCRECDYFNNFNKPNKDERTNQKVSPARSAEVNNDIIERKKNVLERLSFRVGCGARELKKGAVSLKGFLAGMWSGERGA